jgi:hypothetical protein
MSGAGIIFRERLTPRPYVFLIVEALIAMISIAYGVPFGAPVGWVVFAGSSVLAIWALLATSPIIEVTTGTSARLDVLSSGSGPTCRSEALLVDALLAQRLRRDHHPR